MSLSGKFQACLIFYEKIAQKAQNVKQKTFTLLEVCARKNLLLSVSLFLFCWSIFACDVFLCERNLFVKKINRLEIVPITSLYYTTTKILIFICVI